jgi:GWxTD domain-containing protein
MKARTLSLFVAALACVVCAASAAPIPELTAKERAARIKALPEEDRKWIEDYVAPIIMADERNVFLQLTEQHQRETFKEEFWKRREQQGLTWPLGPGYRNRYEEYREAAKTTYDGIGSDAGNVVIRRGEPDNVEEFRDCNEVFRNVEVWTYGRARGNSHADSMQLVFYRPTMARRASSGTRASRTRNPGAVVLLNTIARPAGARARPAPRDRDARRRPCRRPATRRAASSGSSRRKVRGRAEAHDGDDRAPEVNTEGLDKFAESFPTMPSAGAKPLTVESPDPRRRRKDGG